MKKEDYGKLYHIGLKYEAIAHYTYDDGLIYCAKCGEANLRKLEIEHTKDDGGDWRRKYLNGAHTQYQLLKKMNYPDDLGIQVLCAKCNSSKSKKKHYSININIAFDWNNPIPDVQAVPLWDEAS